MELAYLILVVVWNLHVSSGMMAVEEMCKYQYFLDKVNPYQASEECTKHDKTLVSMTDMSETLSVIDILQSLAHYDVDGQQLFTEQLWVGGTSCVLFDSLKTTTTLHDCMDSYPFLCKNDIANMATCYRSTDMKTGEKLMTTGPLNDHLHDAQLNCYKTASCAAVGSSGGSYIQLYSWNSVVIRPEETSKWWVKKILMPNTELVGSVDINSDCKMTSSAENEADITTSATTNLFTIDQTKFLMPASTVELTFSSTVDSSTFANLAIKECESGKRTCGCINATQVDVNLTTMDELSERISMLRKQLIVEKEALSSFRNKKYSAQDNRMSSTAIGYVGAALLGFTFSFIMMMDLPNIVVAMKPHCKRRWIQRKKKTLANKKEASTDNVTMEQMKNKSLNSLEGENASNIKRRNMFFYDSNC